MFGFEKFRACNAEKEQKRQKDLQSFEDELRARIAAVQGIADPAEQYLVLNTLKGDLIRRWKQVTSVREKEIEADYLRKTWKSTAIAGIGVVIGIGGLAVAGPVAVVGALAIGPFIGGMAGMVVLSEMEMQDVDLDAEQLRQRTHKCLTLIDQIGARLIEDNISAFAVSPFVDEILKINPQLKEKMADAFREAAHKAQQQPQPEASQPPRKQGGFQL